MDAEEKIKEIKDRINEVSYESGKYKLEFDIGDKFIVGVVTPDDGKNMLSKISEYQTIYETICDLDWGIKLSLTKALDGEYDVFSDDGCKLVLNTQQEKQALYYIENAIYRDLSLWDMLAQIYRVLYDVKIKVNQVYYNKFFNPSNKNNDRFKNDASVIYKYITADDNVNGEKFKGIHKNVADLRNSMVHRISLGKTTMNNYDFNLRYPLYVQIEIIVEDYLEASQFIKQAFEKVDDEIKNNRTGWMPVYGNYHIK